MMGNLRYGNTWQLLQAGRLWTGRATAVLGWIIALASLPLLRGYEGFQQTPETNWSMIYGSTLLLPLVFVPLWGGVLALMIAVAWGAYSRSWTGMLVARVVSFPVGIVAVWEGINWSPDLSSLTYAVFDKTWQVPPPPFEPLAAGVLLVAIAAWIVPIRRRKSVSPSEGSAQSTGGE